MAPSQEPGFEEHLAELERVVEELEGGGLTLDDQLRRYQDGIERLKACHGLLADAETKVKKLVRDARGVLREDPLDEEGDDAEGASS